MTLQSGLSLDQAPPLDVPMRFFITAPLFAVLAALLALWQGPEFFGSRWNPAMLGGTHLLTLGFMGLVMLGALLQMLPVVAGTPVRRPALVARLIHVPATAGILLLAYGLVFGAAPALRLAMLLLGVTLLSFAALVIATLHHALPQNMTARAMRLAVLMFSGTVLLGLILLSNHAFDWWLQEREWLVGLHLVWGLLGWAGLLIAGVAYQVVPMFQLTPIYPDRLTRWLVPLLFVSLLALAAVADSAVPRLLLQMSLAGGFVVFALSTLYLQAKRRRKLPDVSLDLWRGGLFSLLAAIALWLSAQFVPALGDRPGFAILLGLLMIVGFAMSIINGMLCKIVPFLVWFHLQSRRGAKGGRVPNVREILPDSRSRPQMRLHFAALLMLLAAVLIPLLVYPAALLFALSNLLLWSNIVAATRIYRGAEARPGDSNS
jgi:hypothetical protein